MTELKEWIKGHEKFKSYPYLDTTGHTTIGWGRNLDAKGISLEEGELMINNDINEVTNQLRSYSWYLTQPKNVQYALVNMCFNLGLAGLLGFRKMIRALIAKDYTAAAQEALNSKWAEQVGQRAKDVAVMLRSGDE